MENGVEAAISNNEIHDVTNNSISLVNCSIEINDNYCEVFNIGLNIQADVDISSFKNNRFEDGIIGVYAENFSENTNLTAGSFLTKNVFYKLNTGIELWGGIKADISFNQFEDTETNAVEVYNSELIFNGNSVINGFNYGLQLLGDVKVSSFKNNMISTGRIGVFADRFKGNIALNGGVNERNTFATLEYGIKLNDGYNVSISNNDFSNVEYGIDIKKTGPFNSIVNNKIGFTEVGISTFSHRILDIRDNIVGWNQDNGEIGIKSFHSWGWIENNIVNSDKYGVQLFKFSHKISDNIINVSGNTVSINDPTSPGRVCGIYSAFHGGDIHNNIVSVATNADFGVFISGRYGGSFSNNEVYAQGKDQVYTAALGLHGQSDFYVGDNILEGQFSADGMNIVSSHENTIECNDVTSNRTGIDVFGNSDHQTLLTNQLTSLITDLRIRSQIGPQFHHGNTFEGSRRAEAIELGLDGPIGSKFKTNEEQYHAPLFTNEIDWFKEIPNTIDESCGGATGLTGVSIFEDESRLCHYYINSVKILKNSNPNLYFIKLSQILNYLMNKGIPIPNCINDDLLLTCGVDELTSAYTEINNIAKMDNSNTQLLQAINNVTKFYDGGSNEGVEQDEIYVADYYAFKSRKDSVTLDSIELLLQQLVCNENVKTIWKNTLLDFIDIVQGEELDNARLVRLRSTASLCVYDYGDAVHWARAILSRVEDVNYSVFDDCRTTQQSVKLIPAQITETEHMALYPTVTKDKITIISPLSWEKIDIEIYDLHGRLMWNADNIKSTMYDINLNLNDGTYILKASSSNGEVEVKKFVIID